MPGDIGSWVAVMRVLRGFGRIETGKNAYQRPFSRIAACESVSRRWDDRQDRGGGLALNIGRITGAGQVINDNNIAKINRNGPDKPEEVFPFILQTNENAGQLALIALDKQHSGEKNIRPENEPAVISEQGSA